MVTSLVIYVLNFLFYSIMKKKLIGCSIEEIGQLIAEHDKNTFRAKQIVQWMYEKGETDFSKMTNLSQSMRTFLNEKSVVAGIQFVRIQESADDETYKFLWRLDDNRLVESVLILSEGRRTVCVSSQVGCPVRCAFCASGKQGFFRNLTVDEIVAQVYLIDKWLKQREERVSHIVYMGMGEPFCNYDAVVQSIRILSHPDLMNISQRRITVSTVGVVDGIRRFTQEGLKVHLVLSLHAPNQHIRKKIIPYAREYALEDILDAMGEFFEVTGRDITFEYILIAGINDAPEHAEELALLLKKLKGHFAVNLIPYNPVPGLRLKRPEAQAVKDFRAVLDKYRLVNTCRYTKGDDIAAACGQLALQEEVEQGNAL